MTNIIGGYDTGLWDSSLYLLNRDDKSRQGATGNGEDLYVNISNGNLLIRHGDSYMPSQGEDYNLIRTYNSRGSWNGNLGQGWSIDSLILELSQITDNKITLINPDTSRYVFTGEDSDVFSSVDGAGAYEKISYNKTLKQYTLIASDQTQLLFDVNGTLLKSTDTNGNTITYVRSGGKLITVKDDTGHSVSYIYTGSDLTSVKDEGGTVLASYAYSNGKLVSVTNRAGQKTVYAYNSNGLLASVTLPTGADGVVRKTSFSYDPNPIDSTGKSRLLRWLTDAEGNKTYFEYQFKVDNYNKYDGGTTSMVNALGINRKESNAAEYVNWRVANGYYATWDSNLYSNNSSYKAQANEITKRHTVTYSYDADGAITSVVDQKGYQATYEYDDKENLTSVTDANGYAITSSDDIYWRNLRKDYGYVDASGNGKTVSSLSDDAKDALRERYTSHFKYDVNGNLVKRTDNADNVTTYTYTSFNKIATQTAAMGNALTTSDDVLYQEKRIELGYSVLVAGLSSTDKDALLALYTTTYTYDSKQNITEIKSPGGDLTRFAYDAFGNLTKRTVYLDATDLVTASKQQITLYTYDAFGNNVTMTDAEGNITKKSYDHFGNLLTATDGRSGVTSYTYDNNNRVMTITDPDGHVTTNTYDTAGNRVSVKDAAGHFVYFVYDRNNMLITTNDPSATSSSYDRKTTLIYDVVGNQTAVTDAEGRTTTYTYREDNRLVEVKTPTVSGASTGYTTRYEYDGIGNRISVTDRNGNVTQYVYNQNELLRQNTDAIGNVIQYAYDANLNQVTVVIGAQLAASLRKTLRFGYDEENQRTNETDAMGGVTRSTLDAVGTRTRVTDANGNATDYEYDRNNRVLKEIKASVKDATTGLMTRHTVLHQYDANGNQIAVTDENAHTSRFVFSKDNLLTMATDANGVNTVYTYDSRHNRTSISIGVTASVNASGQVVVSNDDSAQVTTFQYNEFNEVIAKIDGVGNALVLSDNATYQALRTQLGYAALSSGLTAADKTALQNLYTSRYVYDRVGNTTQMIDNLGRITKFEYDQLNRLSRKTDALNNVAETNTYDGNGNRVSQKDALGRTTTFTFDAVNRLTSMKDALNVQTTRAYDVFGNLLEETRAASTTEARTSRYEYDLNNRVTRMTDPGAHTVSYLYDAVGSRLQVTDALGHATRYVYDARNRNIQVIDPLSFDTKFEYDGVGNRLTVTVARGGIQRLEYDPGNRLIQTTDAEGRKVRFEYDVRGNRVVQTTAYGTSDAEVTSYEYDAEANLRAVVDAAGKRSETGFDRVYNRISVKDANGNVTSMAYDALNRSVSVTDAEGGITQFAYDVVSNRLSQTDALGRITSFQYDALNRATTQIAADGVETRYAYDAVGNRVSITHAANTADAATEIFSYDLDNQLIASTDAVNGITRYTYDADHNRIVATDTEGHATQYEYDANSRVIKIIDAEGGVVRYVYDGNGNRVQVIDARGNATTSYFNSNNEVTLTVDAEGYATAFAYDNNGNVVSKTLHTVAVSLPVSLTVAPSLTVSASDQITRYSYDKLNRLTVMTDAEGYVTRYTYDAVGNRVSTQRYLDLAQTKSETTRAYYDKDNRVRFVLSAEGYLAESRYDATGNRLSQIQYDQRVAVPVSGQPAPVAGDVGRMTQYQYDTNNRLTREISALNITTAYAYDARGNRISMTDAFGTAEARTTTYGFDKANRLIDSTDAAGTRTHLVLDADGNVVEQRDAYGTMAERVTRYTYDRLHRATSETNPIGVVTRMVYDAAGNMLERIVADGLPEARSEHFSYNRLSHLVEFINGENERTTYAYDGAGNRTRVTQAPGLLEERITTSVYDRDNRLVEMHDGLGVITAFVYDGVGNKLEKISAFGIAGQERRARFSYDLDNRLVTATDPLNGVTRYEYDVLGNQTKITDALGRVQISTFDILGRLATSLSAAGILTANQYDLHNNLISTTQSFADGSDARTTTYAYDLLDRQVLVTDAKGYSTRISYDVFGNQTLIEHALYLPTLGDAGYDAAKAARAFPQNNSFIYDAVSRMQSMLDAEGNLTTYTYDAVGNRTSVKDGNGNITAYAFDLANRLIETITPEGGISRNTYNEVGDKVAEDMLQSDTGGVAVWVHHTFEYDDNGRMIAETDGEGVRTEHVYDAVGNMLSHHFAAGTTDERTVRMEYDLNNRKSADIDALGNRTEYRFDAVGNRTRVTDARGEVAHYYYDAANRTASVLDPEGYITTFQYDAADNRIEERLYINRYVGAISDTTPPSPIASSLDRIARTTYTRTNQAATRAAADGSRTDIEYDGAGNMVKETLYANTNAPRLRHYAYDRDNRLVQFIDVDGTATVFTYDVASNRTSQIIGQLSEIAANNSTLISTDIIQGTADYNLIGGSAEVTEQQTVLTQYNRNNGALTAVQTWSGASLIETNATGSATEAQIRYDASGNGLAVWIIGADLYYRSYNATTETWGVEAKLDGSLTGTPSKAHLSTSSNGNALVTWIQNSNIYARRLIAGVWDGAATIPLLENATGAALNPVGAINNNGRAIVTFIQTDGTRNNLLANVFNGTDWSTAATNLDDRGTANNNALAATMIPSVAIDSAGEATVTWLQKRGSETVDSVIFGRYTASTNTWANPNSTTIENTSTAMVGAKIAFDSNGNGQVVWAQGSGTSYTLYAKSYTKSTNAWGAAVTLGTSSVTPKLDLAMSANGNTLVSWVKATGDVHVRRYVGGAWAGSASESVEALAGAVLNPNGAINDAGQATVIFVQTDGTRNNIYANRYTSSWQGATLLESSTNAIASSVIPQAAIDNSGNVQGIWLQKNAAETTESVTVNRYNNASQTYYLVQSGDTWSSIATALYGNAAVADDLSVALGNPALTAGLKITTAPATLTDTQIITVPVNPYYVVQAGDTWSSIATALYGNGAVADELSAYYGAANLDAGTKLANLPSFFTETFTQTISVTPYYAVQSGDTWASITQTVYGTSVPEAVAALQAALGNPSLTLGVQLIVPTNLEYLPTTGNDVRVTTYAYDRNNRKTVETYDPTSVTGGLNFIQRLAYDKLGNVIGNTDANGNTSVFAYDLNNRVVSETNALGEVTGYGYDAVGNRTRTTDARGNAMDYVYDANNRMTQEIWPSVTVYTRTNGLQTLRPTAYHQYDAVGNEVQTTDANGFIKTNYFDGNNHLVAALSGDNVLREYVYDGAGDMIGDTLHMTRLAAIAHDPNTRPVAPAGEKRVMSYQYDLMGRLTRTIYPQVTITSLSGTNTDAPVAIQSVIQPEERIVYDAYGNKIEQFDKNGNRSLVYYDVKGRQIATVDGAGYLVEFDYDAQDNLLEQRTYTQPLDVTSLNTASRPVAPSGEVYVSTRRYDIANRMIEEITPTLSLFDSATQLQTSERISTQFTYDAVGNQTSRKLASGTAQQQIEYSYYDAGNRRVALINGTRVVHQFKYDANGNMTLQARFYNVLGNSIDASTLNGATNFAALVASSDQDQTKTFGFDAMNRGISETDLMGAGSADDLVQLFNFDAGRNRTWKQDELGYITESSYDAEGRSLETVAPDGTGTLAQYDAAGNQIYAYTGKIANQAAPASNIGATLGNALNVSWTLPAGSNLQSWVAYDSVSHSNIDDYASKSTSFSTAQGYSAKAAIAVPGNGQTLYFRVVTQDIAGNLTWSAEQSMTIPPRFSQLSVSEPTSGTLEISARFDAGAVSPTLYYGLPGSTNTPVAFILQADGSHKATLTGVSNAQSLAYRLEWQDGAGATYSSAEAKFESALAHDSVTSDVSQSTVIDATGTKYRINVTSKIPTALAAGFVVVSAEWRVVGSGLGFASTAVSGVDSGLGYTTFALVLGQDTPFVAGAYEVILHGASASGDTVIDRFEYTVGSGALPITQQSLSWAAPAVGDGQLVTVGDQLVASTRQDGRLFIDADLTAGAYSYDVRYTQSFSVDHSLNLTSTPIIVMVGIPPMPVITGYDLSVATTLDSSELSNIGAGPRLAWRPVGGSFTDVALASSGPTSFSTTLANLASGNYELKLYYTDTQGREVILDWKTVDATQSATSNTKSQTVLASERDGSVTLDLAGLLTVDSGLYLGPIDQSILPDLGLALSSTGQPIGSRDTDGRSTGYAVETQFNALNAKIAGGENDNLWREYGVDANGNIVQTKMYGAKGAAASIDSYAAYDARNRKTAMWDAKTTPFGEAVARHAVTRTQYNVLDKVTQETDAQGYVNKTEYNAIGAQTKTIDAFGNTTQMRFDRLGNETQSIDQLGHSRYKYYDANGRMIKERDGAGIETAYQYDAFERRIAMISGLGINTAEADDYTMRYYWDQRDRLTRIDQAQGWHLANSNEEIYATERTRLGFDADANLLTSDQRDALIAQYRIRLEYDGKNNRTGVIDARGNRTTEVFDALNRVTDSITLQGGAEIHERRQYDAYGNVIAEIDGDGRTTIKRYAGAGRVAETTDAGGVRTLFEYDQYGRAIREYNPDGGKDLRKYYDAAGRIIKIDDLGTGVATTFEHDIAGQRIHEVTTGPHSRDIRYSYDFTGRMVRFADSVTGINQNTWYDSVGNQVRVFSDLGWDPDGKNTTPVYDVNGDQIGTEAVNPNYRLVDHVYTFDGANRITQTLDQVTNADNTSSQTIVSGYTYDAAGQRATWNNAGTYVNYQFDANSRVARGNWTQSGAAWASTWDYDANGNVIQYRTTENGAQKSLSTSAYLENNRVSNSNDDGQDITRSYDLAGHTTQLTMRSSGKTYYYNYSYTADGRESSISAYGDASGNSSSSYDVNQQLVNVNRGQGDGMSRAQYSTFSYNNEGKILYRFHDDGKSATPEQTEYAYANSNVIGETGTGLDGAKKTLLDTGRYNFIQNISKEFPGGAVSGYSVKDGDSLQTIAAAVYGDAGLWYVLAEANGLRAGESLISGTKLTIPNHISNASLNADTHRVYNEGDIIGSTLPDLKTPPPPKKGKGCGAIIAIILVVVIAIFAPYLIGLLATYIGPVLGSTLLSYAIAGAVVGAAVSIVSQGILIAAGLQEEFSWKQVAAGAVSGAIGGAAQGIEVVAKAGQLKELLGVSQSFAKVAAVALKVASVAVKQVIESGKITSWTSLAAAGIGQAYKFDEFAAVGNATNAVEEGTYTAATKAEFIKQASDAVEAQKVLSYITPWVQLAETAIRNDGKLQPSDWANAIGSTLEQVVTTDTGGGFLGQNFQSKLAVNLFVGGALSMLDEDAGVDYLINSVGNTIGTEIGGALVAGLKKDDPTYDAEFSFDPVRGDFVNGKGESLGATSPSRVPAVSALSPEELEGLRANTDKALAKQLAALDIYDAGLDEYEDEVNSPFKKVSFVEDAINSGKQSAQEFIAESREKIQQTRLGLEGTKELILSGGAGGERFDQIVTELTEANPRLANVLLGLQDTAPTLIRAIRDDGIEALTESLPEIVAGLALIAIDVINTPVSPTPDVGIVGAAILASRAVKAGNYIGTFAEMAKALSPEQIQGAVRAVTSNLDELEGLKAKGLGIGNDKVQRILEKTMGLADKAFVAAVDTATKGNRVANAGAKFLMNVGNFGEYITSQVLQVSGLLTDLRSVQNTSGHGIDLIGKDRFGGLGWVSFEVKAGFNNAAPGLKGDQRLGANDFTRSRLGRARDGFGIWSAQNADEGRTGDFATRVLKEQGKKDFTGFVVQHNFINDSSRLSVNISPWVKLSPANSTPRAQDQNQTSPNRRAPKRGKYI